MDIDDFASSKRCKNIKWSKLHKRTIDSLKDYLSDKSKLSEIDIVPIIRLLENDFSEYNITERLNEIKKLKKDSNSKHSYTLRYGKEKGEELFKKRNNRSKITSSKKYYIEKFGYEKANEMLKNRTSNNEEVLKKKFPNDWERRLKEYKNNFSFSNSKEGYIKKYGEKEGKRKWKERKQKTKFCNSKAGYIKKYGKKEGERIWNEKNKKLKNHAYKNSKQYYINTYGEEKGKILCKRNSILGRIESKYGEEYLQEFIKKTSNKRKKPILTQMKEKYGEEKGIKKYEKYIRKQKYVHTLDYFIDKYGEKDGYDKFLNHKKKIVDNLINSKNKSNISQELFDKLRNELETDDNLFYHDHNKEKSLIDSESSKIFFYDFLFKDKIIEFHGDFWHMNPSIYNKNDINKKTGFTAEEIWHQDKYKRKIAESKGFIVKTIWESDYKNNEKKVLNECKNFLENG